MSNGIGRVWAVNAEGGDEGRPNGVGPVYIENADQLGSKLPEPAAGDAGKVLGVLNSSGDIGWVEDQSGTLTQVQSDWTEDDSSQVSYIQNKPTLATVATSGSYNDLSNKPTIPAAQVNSDWDAASGVAQILNKPALATVATSGSYNDLSNKPTIPTVDQSYSAVSTNAQSGVAVAGALANIKQVPSSTSADEDKVLTVNSSGTPVWATAQGGGSSYTAGAGIDITSDVISAKIDNSTLTTDAIDTDYAEFSSSHSYGYDVNLYNTRIGGSLYQQDPMVYTFHIPAGGLELGNGVNSDNIYPVLRASELYNGEYRVNQKLNATLDSNTGHYIITGGQTFKICFNADSPYFPVAMNPSYSLSSYSYLTFGSFTASQIEDNSPSNDVAGANSNSATIAFDYKTSGTTLSVNTEVVQPKLTAGNGIAISDSNVISVYEGEEVPITSSTSSSYQLGAKLNYNHLRIYFHKYNGSSSSGHLIKDVYSDVSFQISGIVLSDFYYDTLGTTYFSVSMGSSADTINVGSSYFNTVSGGQIFADNNSSWVIDKIFGFNDSPFASQS